MRQININCDMAEGFGAYEIGDDAALLKIAASANVACGFHGGDPRIMRKFAAEAVKAGVSIGAHPGFPDLQGFGRRRMVMDPADIEAMVAYQIGALQALARSVGSEVTHVKPHGALANMAAEDRTYADAISRAIWASGPGLISVVLYGSQQQASAESFGQPFAREGYADRLYDDNGNLVARSQPGAVIHDVERAATQACKMARDRQVQARSGKILDVEIDTICVHGDGPGAVAIARRIRDELRATGVRIVPLDRMQLPNHDCHNKRLRA